MHHSIEITAPWPPDVNFFVHLVQTFATKIFFH